MEKRDYNSIPCIENVALDVVIVNTLEHIQHEETARFYDELLKLCQRMAIEKPELFDDSDALKVIRGFHMLRDDLYRLQPYRDGRQAADVPEPESKADSLSWAE